MKEYTCVIAGHRNIPRNKINYVKQRLREEIEKLIKQGVINFCTKADRGFETIAALLLLELQKRNNNIKLILVSSCAEETRLWDKSDIAVYEQIKLSCAEHIKISEHFTYGCVQKRNRHLVDTSSVMLTYHRKVTGDTAFIINYAEKRDLPIINIFNDL